jgi:hypothetical protein
VDAVSNSAFDSIDPATGATQYWDRTIHAEGNLSNGGLPTYLDTVYLNGISQNDFGDGNPEDRGPGAFGTVKGLSIIVTGQGILGGNLDANTPGGSITLDANTGSDFEPPQSTLSQYTGALIATAPTITVASVYGGIQSYGGGVTLNATVAINVNNNVCTTGVDATSPNGLSQGPVTLNAGSGTIALITNKKIGSITNTDPTIPTVTTITAATLTLADKSTIQGYAIGTATAITINANTTVTATTGTATNHRVFATAASGATAHVQHNGNLTINASSAAALSISRTYVGSLAISGSLTITDSSSAAVSITCPLTVGGAMTLTNSGSAALTITALASVGGAMTLTNSSTGSITVGGTTLLVGGAYTATGNNAASVTVSATAFTVTGNYAPSSFANCVITSTTASLGAIIDPATAAPYLPTTFGSATGISSTNLALGKTSMGVGSGVSVGYAGGADPKINQMAFPLVAIP